MDECAHLQGNSDPCIETFWIWEIGDADGEVVNWSQIVEIKC